MWLRVVVCVVLVAVTSAHNAKVIFSHEDITTQQAVVDATVEVEEFRDLHVKSDQHGAIIPLNAIRSLEFSPYLSRLVQAFTEEERASDTFFCVRVTSTGSVHLENARAVRRTVTFCSLDEDLESAMAVLGTKVEIASADKRFSPASVRARESARFNRDLTSDSDSGMQHSLESLDPIYDSTAEQTCRALVDRLVDKPERAVWTDLTVGETAVKALQRGSITPRVNSLEPSAQPTMKDFIKNAWFTLTRNSDLSLYVHQSDDTIYMAFKGTSTISEGLGDLEVLTDDYSRLTKLNTGSVPGWIMGSAISLVGGVGRWFSYAKSYVQFARAIYDEIIKLQGRDTNVVFCGHSLGGFMAQVLGLYAHAKNLPSQTYTTNAPGALRAFADNSEAWFGTQIALNPVPVRSMFNIANFFDWVPQLGIFPGLQCTVLEKRFITVFAHSAFVPVLTELYGLLDKHEGVPMFKKAFDTYHGIRKWFNRAGVDEYSVCDSNRLLDYISPVNECFRQTHNDFSILEAIHKSTRRDDVLCCYPEDTSCGLYVPKVPKAKLSPYDVDHRYSTAERKAVQHTINSYLAEFKSEHLKYESTLLEMARELQKLQDEQDKARLDAEDLETDLDS
eukprot:GILK01012987.1.p1 GENE.GILK01012987.1~~GILK01012987.1.p1  ORF type:complete len:618 (+),score=95.05 GILK01012987.1:58-1911(+)